MVKNYTIKVRRGPKIQLNLKLHDQDNNHK